MKTLVHFLLVLLLTGQAASGQALVERLNKAVHLLLVDTQLKHAIVSFCVADEKSGRILFSTNADLGVAPASCQKLFTSAAAFELLGPQFRYKTTLSYLGDLREDMLAGLLVVTGSEDPTLGSWRWPETNGQFFLSQIIHALKISGVKKIRDGVLVGGPGFTSQPIPDGWIWQDIGNYYGAGCWPVNWNENQYELLLKTGDSIGQLTSVVGQKPQINGNLVNDIRTGPADSEDEGYIYLPAYTTEGSAHGTIPKSVSNFAIKGALTNPALVLNGLLDSSFADNQIEVRGAYFTQANWDSLRNVHREPETLLWSYYSPSLDSINYCFLKNSINLYGEAFVKTIAYHQSGWANTDTGVAILKNFWAGKGIESSALHLVDGSGLSPENRVTSKALVYALQYAKSRPWFSSFFESLPKINGLKMKSGAINGVRSFAGYAETRSGLRVTFALVINNYEGSSHLVVTKMWHLLDVLKY